MSLDLDRTISSHFDPACITHLLGIEYDLKRAVGDVFLIFLDTDQVLFHLMDLKLMPILPQVVS